VLILVTAVGAMATGSMAKLSSSTWVTGITGVTLVSIVFVVPVVVVVPEVVLVVSDGVTKVVPVVEPEVDSGVDLPETFPVVALVDPPVVAVAVPSPLVLILGVEPPPTLRFLNKKINPMIKPISNKAPNKYQIHDGHANPFFLAFLFSSTGAGTVLTTGAVTTSSLSTCFGW
jgi:hypothetical protein